MTTTAPPPPPSQTDPITSDPYVIYQLRKPSQRGTAVIPRFVPNTHAPAFSPANYRFARVWATDTSIPLFQAPRSFEFAPSLGSESTIWSDTSSYLSLSTLRTAPSERPSLLHATQQPIFLPRRASLAHSPTPSDFNADPHFKYPSALSESVDEDAVVDDLLASMNTPQFPQLRNAPSPHRSNALIHPDPRPMHRSNVRSSRAVRNHHHHRPILGSLLPSITKKRRSLWQWLFCSDTTAASTAVPSASTSNAAREITHAPPAPNRRAPAPRVRNAHDAPPSKQSGSKHRGQSLERSSRSSSDKHHTARAPWNFLAKGLLSRDRSKSRDRRAGGSDRKRDGHRPFKHTTSTKDLAADSQRTKQNRIVFQKTAAKTPRAEKHASTHRVKRKDIHGGKTHHLKTDSSQNGASRSHRARTEKNDNRSKPEQSHLDRSRSDRHRSDRSNIEKDKSPSKSPRPRNEHNSNEKRKEDRPRVERARADRPKQISPRKDRPRRPGAQQIPNNVVHSAMNKGKVPSIIDHAAAAAKSHGDMQRMPSADSADPVTSRISSDLSSSTYGKTSRSDSGQSPLLRKADYRTVSLQEEDPKASAIGSDVSSLISGGLEKRASPVPYASYQSPVRSPNAPPENLSGGVSVGPQPYRPASPKFPGVSLKNGALVKDSQRPTSLKESTNLPIHSSKKGMSTTGGMSVPYRKLEAAGSLPRQKSRERPAGGTLSQHSSLLFDADDTASTGLTSLADESVSTHKSVSTRMSALNEDFPFVVETDAQAVDEPRAAAAAGTKGVEYQSLMASEGLFTQKPIFQNSALVLNTRVSPSFESSTTSPRYHSDWSHPHATPIDVFCQCSCTCVYEEECRRKCELMYERSSSASSSSRSRQGYRGFTSLPPAIHTNGMRIEQIMRQEAASGQDFSDPRVIEAMPSRRNSTQRRLARASEVDELPDLYTSQLKKDASLYPRPSDAEPAPYSQTGDQWQGRSGTSNLHQGPALRNLSNRNVPHKRHQPSRPRTGGEIAAVETDAAKANQVSGLKPPNTRRYSSNSSSHHSCDNEGSRKAHARRRGRHSVGAQEQIAKRRAGDVGFDQAMGGRSGSHSYPRTAHLSQIQAL